MALLCTHHKSGENQTALVRKNESLERQNRQKVAEGVHAESDYM